MKRIESSVTGKSWMMKMRHEERQRWLEARKALAEEIVRAYAASPKSVTELRTSSQASDRLFDAALNHLVAAGRLPRDVLPKTSRQISKEEEAFCERLLAHLAANDGCATDMESLRSSLHMDDQRLWQNAIDSLMSRNAIIAASERVFLLPDDACLGAILDQLPPRRFSVSEIVKTKAAALYAAHVGMDAERVAPIVVQSLEKHSRIVKVGDGEYLSRSTLESAVRRIRAAFEEYRPYRTEELLAAVKIDEWTLRHVLADLEKKGSLRQSGVASFRPTGSLSTRGWPCCECGARTQSIDIFHDKPLCWDCRSRLPEKYGCITKTRALTEYRLKEHELYRLTYLQRDNPHHKNGRPMQLFLLNQVRDLAKTKWGRDDPYIISLTEVSRDQLQWLQEDPERLKQLTPERFEILLADRFEAMGLCVQLIGQTNERDGGIDLIAYPDPGSNQPKYLLAVQAEHHRTDRKTGAPKVQKFVGAMSAVSQFRLGFVVTNTAFTWTAEEYAKNQSHFLRLRSLEDLLRWFRDDFNNEAEWREIPDFIDFGGFRIPILKPKLPPLLDERGEIIASDADRKPPRKG
jgi:hypothetical protein